MARRRPVEEVQDEVTSAKKSLVLRLTEDGKVDVESMRPQTVEALKAALAGTSILAGESDDELVNAFETKKAVYAQVVPPIFGLIGGINSLFFAKRLKLPYDDVQKVMGYTEEEIAMLTDPAATVLAKRMPDTFGWTEEVTLLLVGMQIQQQKMQALQELQARSAKKVVDIRKEPEVSVQ